MHPISDQPEPASIFLVAVGADNPLPWQVLAIIRAADAAFFDRDVEYQVLELCGPRCYREEVRSQRTAADFALSGKIARMQNLASDGWRVIRFIARAADIAAEVQRLEAVGINVRVLSGVVRGESRAYPERFATSLNGLAG